MQHMWNCSANINMVSFDNVNRQQEFCTFCNKKSWKRNILYGDISPGHYCQAYFIYHFVAFKQYPLKKINIISVRHNFAAPSAFRIKTLKIQTLTLNLFSCSWYSSGCKFHFPSRTNDIISVWIVIVWKAFLNYCSYQRWFTSMNKFFKFKIVVFWGVAKYYDFRLHTCNNLGLKLEICCGTSDFVSTNTVSSAKCKSNCP